MVCDEWLSATPGLVLQGGYRSHWSLSRYPSRVKPPILLLLVPYYVYGLVNFCETVCPKNIPMPQFF